MEKQLGSRPCLELAAVLTAQHWELALLNPTPEQPPVSKCYLSQVQCQQICFVLEMTHCSLLCCNLQLLFPVLSHRSLPDFTRKGVRVCEQRPRGARG